MKNRIGYACINLSTPHSSNRGIKKQTFGIPITFDFLHHDCHPDNTTEQEALEMALSTWPSDVIPCTHYSSSKKLHEDASMKKLAHAEYIYEEIQTYGKVFDIVLEAKAKDLAVLKYKKDYVKTQTLAII